MKRLAYVLSLVAATAMAAAPLAAQSSGNGPWWDPGRTQPETSGRHGTVYGGHQNGSVHGQQNQQADGVWRAYSRDRNGNTVYMRTRYDSNGNLVREYATRNIIGRYSVIDRQVLSNNNGDNGQYGHQRGTYDTRGTYDRRRNDDRNDRWDQNNGHDNGKHNGRYKNKNKNRGRGNDRDDYDR
ncbi:MAG: hypothetical protein ABIQ55_11245 [Gemmatimonadaceae bacterium]